MDMYANLPGLDRNLDPKKFRNENSLLELRKVLSETRGTIAEGKEKLAKILRYMNRTRQRHHKARR